jgi:hypothetical protein
MELLDEMKEWAKKAFDEARAETPDVTVLVMAISRNDVTGMGWGVMPELTQTDTPTAYGFGWAYAEMEDAVTALAVNVWNKDPHGRVLASVWPEDDGDYRHTEMQHPSTQGDMDGAALFFLNLMLLMEVLVPVPTVSTDLSAVGA